MTETEWLVVDQSEKGHLSSMASKSAILVLSSLACLLPPSQLFFLFYLHWEAWHVVASLLGKELYFPHFLLIDHWNTGEFLVHSLVLVWDRASTIVQASLKYALILSLLSAGITDVSYQAQLCF